MSGTKFSFKILTSFSLHILTEIQHQSTIALSTGVKELNCQELVKGENMVPFLIHINVNIQAIAFIPFCPFDQLQQFKYHLPSVPSFLPIHRFHHFHEFHFIVLPPISFKSLVPSVPTILFAPSVTSVPAIPSVSSVPIEKLGQILYATSGCDGCDKHQV